MRKILTISALLVSLFAMIFSGAQTYFTRQHNRVSISPYLDWRLDMNNHPTLLELRLINVGLGPAIVKDILVTFDKETLGRAGLETCSKINDVLNINESKIDASYCWIIDEDEEVYVREDEDLTIYRVTSNNKEQYLTPEATYKKLGLLVEYCGLYADCTTLGP